MAQNTNIQLPGDQEFVLLGCCCFLDVEVNILGDQPFCQLKKLQRRANRRDTGLRGR
jgi:hypothetical protein